MFTEEFEKFNWFNEKSDVKISARSITLKNEGKTKAVFNRIRFVATKGGIYKGSWDFDGVKSLRSIGVMEQKAQSNIFECKGKLFYIKPSMDKTDTSKWENVAVLNVEYVNGSKTY